MGTSRGGSGGIGVRGGRGRGGFGPRSFEPGPQPSAAGRKAFARVKQLSAVAEKAEEDDEYYFNELAKNSRHPIRHPQLNENTLFATQGAVGLNFDQYDDIKVERSGQGEEKIPVMRSFAELGERLPRFLSRNIELMRYDRPTPIQAHSVPVALNKMDLMCCAQTGSGKTCAYLLPLIATMHGAPRTWQQQFEGRSAAPLALVMAPTRELAVQIHIEAQKLSNRSGMHPLVVYGGAKARQQLYELAQGVDVLVATPGRLQDFCDRGLVTLSHVKFLVLDEADRMLDMGFEPQIRALHKLMTPPAERQTLMFSATFPPAVQKLAAEFTRNYIWISVGRVGSTVASIEQRIIYASNNKFHKLALLVEAFDSCKGRTLVFVKTKAMATWVARQMRSQPGFRNLRTAEIHGDRTQSQREEALQAFRDGQVQVLVATDVAARGLDIAGVAHVVNFDLASTPDEFDSYVHRIGRTGRAGNAGIATSFYVPGFDPKTGCGRIAGQLLQLLRETNQVIPDWFLQLPEVKSLGSTGNHGGSRNETKFGGRDVRNLGARPKSHSLHHDVHAQQPSQPAPQHFAPGIQYPQEHKVPNGVSGGNDAPSYQQTQPSRHQHQRPAQGPPRGPPRYSQDKGRPQEFHYQDAQSQQRGLLPDPRIPSYGHDQTHQPNYNAQQRNPQQQHQQQQQPRFREFQPGQPWQAQGENVPQAYQQQPQRQWDESMQRPAQPRHVVITRQQLQQQVNQVQQQNFLAQQQSFQPLPFQYLLPPQIQLPQQQMQQQQMHPQQQVQAQTLPQQQQAQPSQQAPPQQQPPAQQQPAHRPRQPSRRNGPAPTAPTVNNDSGAQQTHRKPNVSQAARPQQGSAAQNMPPPSVPQQHKSDNSAKTRRNVQVSQQPGAQPGPQERL